MERDQVAERARDEPHVRFAAGESDPYEMESETYEGGSEICVRDAHRLL